MSQAYVRIVERSVTEADHMQKGGSQAATFSFVFAITFLPKTGVSVLI